MSKLVLSVSVYLSPSPLPLPTPSSPSLSLSLSLSVSVYFSLSLSLSLLPNLFPHPLLSHFSFLLLALILFLRLALDRERVDPGHFFSKRVVHRALEGKGMRRGGEEGRLHRS